MKTCETQLRDIERAMDSHGLYHPDLARITSGLKRSVARDVQESMRRITLNELLNASGTTGIAGAAYLVPVKIHDELIMAVKSYDIAPLISLKIVSGWKGGALDIPIVIDESYVGKVDSSGGLAPADTPAFVKATLTPKLIDANLVMSESLLEDSQYSLLDWCTGQAAKVIAFRQNEELLKVLIAGTGGDGTLNSALSGDADETKVTGGTTTDVAKAFSALGDDRFVGNTMVATSEAWRHSISATTALGWQLSQPAPGYDAKLGVLDVVFSNSPVMHKSSDLDGAVFTDCITLIFDRRNALITGRKRWLQIEKYADPVRDISGAVVTARVGAVTAYNDSIYKITET